MPIPWSVHATEITWWPSDVYMTWWESSTSIGIFGSQILYGEVGTDAIIPYQPTPIPAVFSFLASANYSVSGQGTYAIECTRGGLTLYSKFDPVAISRTPIRLTDCEDGYASTVIAWALDETATAFISPKGEIYIWDTIGTPPHKVGVTAMSGLWPTWSPDSQKLLAADAVPSYAEYRTFNVFYRDGRSPTITGALIGMRSESPPDWLTPDIVVNYTQCGAACSSYTFYDAFTGEELTGYGKDLEDPSSPGGDISPDRRWLIAVQYDSEQPYIVYDFKTRARYALDTDPSHAYSFEGWASDSSTFHMIRRPASGYPWLPDYQSPGELLAFNPITRQFESVLPNIVYVKRGDAQGDFFAITTQPQAEGVTLMGAIYDHRGRPVTALQPLNLSSAPEQTWKESAFIRANGSPFLASWSPQETLIVYIDWQGAVGLFDRSSGFMRLTTQFPLEDWPSRPLLAWSPDERQLLLASPTRAWIVSLP